MSSQWRCLTLPVGALLAAIAPGLAAQDLPAALQACKSEVDEARRLACYDREVETQRQPPTTGTASPAAVPAASLTPEERFGYDNVFAHDERNKGRYGTEGLEELVATVTGISRRSDGAIVITLGNGQVWRQISPDPYFRLKTGEQVKIKPAALGSFLLYGDSKSSTRVTRLR